MIIDDEATPHFVAVPPLGSVGQLITAHKTESEIRVSKVAVDILLSFFESGNFVSKCLDRVNLSLINVNYPGYANLSYCTLFPGC